MSNESQVWPDYVKIDSDWKLMRKRYSNLFYEKYNQGFVDYIEGNWNNARINLTMAEVII